MKILVLDDFREIEEVYRCIIDRFLDNYEMRFVSNPNDSSYANKEYDLAFIDWHLGKGDGNRDVFATDLIDRINAKHMCLVTGYHKNRVANIFAKINNMRVLYKPIFPYAIETEILYAKKALGDKKTKAQLNSISPHQQESPRY